MKKIILFTALLSVLALGTVNAQQIQFRLDANLSVPVYVGYFSSTLGGTYGQALQYAFVVPEAGAYLQLNMNMFRMGIGVRLFTIILESMLTPDIFAELNIDPLVIRLGVSGGGIILFGIFSYGPEFGPTFAPDLYVGFKIAEIFRVGAGCTVIMNLNNPDVGLFAPYINAKLVVALPNNNTNED